MENLNVPQQLSSIELVANATKKALKSFPTAFKNCNPSPQASLQVMCDLIRAYVDHEYNVIMMREQQKSLPNG